MVTHEIAVVPGDGIGNEVTESAMTVLKAITESNNFDIELDTFDWGSQRYLNEGEMMPEDGLDQLEDFDSVFLGAVGHPDVPDHITLSGLLLPIRKGFDQYICKRPNVLFDGIESPLRGYTGNEIDLVVYRENTEGEYADVGGREHRNQDHEVAIQSATFTRRGTERIVRRAFEAAVDRDGHLTSVTKSNVQTYSMVLWDDIVEEVSEEFPEVTVERLLVDRAAMDLVQRPDKFDVLVASNLFGDIVTDVAAAVTGSLGLAPSGNINPEGTHPSMFEPVHGSAPDIVGEGTANPLASILTGAMMLDHLGEPDAATEVRRAVDEQLAASDGPRTPDLGGTATTDIVTEDLLDWIRP
ncbi:tartrate dehydrogenase [Natronorubrum sp. FCH18a]|uniref:tartrate dehydrogenase n=1 Tax=Natronorubrum sp. FCH18a TaxID=3447018 RepID=UPI003F514B71